MPELPESDLLLAPSIESTATKVAAFDALLQPALRGASAPELEYDLPYPKYEFLSWLVEARGYLLHGANDPGIVRFEPRLQTDYVGRPVEAVFGASDGIWPMFFAILNRVDFQGFIWNHCLRRDGVKHYFFSVSAPMFERGCWTAGTVYVLSRESFRAVVDDEGNALEEWTSTVAVSPVAKLAVSADDFPFLAKVRTHVDADLSDPEVAECQQLLLNLGYELGLPDGVAGAETTNALRRFQEDVGLEATGALDSRTRSRLRLIQGSRPTGQPSADEIST